MAWNLQVGPEDELAEGMPMGEAAYQKYCVSCHQADRKGLAASGFPSLLDLQLRKEKAEVAHIITNGKGMMTGFPQIKKEEMDALLQFLWGQEVKHNVVERRDKKETGKIGLQTYRLQ